MTTLTTRVLVPALALPLLAAPALAAVPGKITRESYPFQARTIVYYLYVPTTVTAGRPAPMVVLLHGAGANGSSLVERWKTLAEQEGIILAGPDAAAARRWSLPADGPEPLCALVGELRKTLPVNARRIYLFGHGTGAVFALHVSLLESEYFAATAVHSGALQTPAEFKALDMATRKIPIGLLIGDRDGYYPKWIATPTADALRTRGLLKYYNVMKGRDHEYDPIADQVNALVWAFLKDITLPADPVYTPQDAK